MKLYFRGNYNEDINRHLNKILKIDPKINRKTYSQDNQDGFEKENVGRLSNQISIFLQRFSCYNMTSESMAT